MLKKGFFGIAAAVVLAMSAQAGEIKIHNWPTAFTPLPICTVNVTMDIGFWIQVKSQTMVIKLTQSQTNIHNYDGCTTYTFANNFQCILSATIARANIGTPDKPAYIVDNTGTSYMTVDLDRTTFDPSGSNQVKVCAHVVGANLGAIQAGNKDVKVGVVTILVVPAI